MKKNGGQHLAASDVVYVEIAADEGHGFLIPIDELTFLPRASDMIEMPAHSGSAETSMSYEVTGVQHRFGLTGEHKQGKLMGISVGLRKLQ